APLEIAEADLALAGADAMLHVPAPEGHAQQPPQRRPRRRIGHNIFLLPCGRVTGPDQPVGPGAAARHPHLRRLDLPRRSPCRLVLQPETPPTLAEKGRAMPHQVVGPAGTPPRAP